MQSSVPCHILGNTKLLPATCPHPCFPGLSAWEDPPTPTLKPQQYVIESRKSAVLLHCCRGEQETTKKVTVGIRAHRSPASLPQPQSPSRASLWLLMPF